MEFVWTSALLVLLVVWGLPIIGLVLLLWLGWRYFDRRYKSGQPGEAGSDRPASGYERTGEVFIDPKDGLRYRVYYHPGNGNTCGSPSCEVRLICG
ncbi:HD family phosphohydrolase [Paenibacillus sp. IB182496]|uniref:HD family phosphohydrolase n=1 Tax=Paenibacillus sabuli TaxID=2772509 RepID=A0A927BVP5_9BACL|nr:HD family phosphohydrolase [Paenibacillus sabuli]MBD2847706.1 HD family phosphohydrolase [Paenibacillus sabuli]